MMRAAMRTRLQLSHTMFSYLLALLLLVSSVSIASHVHVEHEVGSDEQVEDCSVCYLLHFQSHPNDLPIVSPLVHIEGKVAVAYSFHGSIEQILNPPARGPPTIS